MFINRLFKKYISEIDDSILGRLVAAKIVVILIIIFIILLILLFQPNILFG